MLVVSLHRAPLQRPRPLCGARGAVPIARRIRAIVHRHRDHSDATNSDVTSDDKTQLFLFKNRSPQGALRCPYIYRHIYIYGAAIKLFEPGGEL